MDVLLKVSNSGANLAWVEFEMEAVVNVLTFKFKVHFVMIRKLIRN